MGLSVRDLMQRMGVFADALVERELAQVDDVLGRGD